MKTLKVKVRDLKVGDRLTSFATVLSSPSRGLKTPSGKVDIKIHYNNGYEKVQTWGANTTVSIFDKVELTAKRFSALLLEEVGLEDLQAINIYNDNMLKDSTMCASHDFCDANQIMLSAYVSIGSIGAKDVEIMNQAWMLAKENKFYI